MPAPDSLQRTARTSGPDWSRPYPATGASWRWGKSCRRGLHARVAARRRLPARRQRGAQCGLSRATTCRPQPEQRSLWASARRVPPARVLHSPPLLPDLRAAERVPHPRPSSARVGRVRGFSDSRDAALTHARNGVSRQRSVARQCLLPPLASASFTHEVRHRLCRALVGQATQHSRHLRTTHARACPVHSSRSH